MITIEQLGKVFLRPSGEVLDMLLDNMLAAGIDTPRRAAAFCAQIFVESNGLQYTREIGGEKRSYAPWFGRGWIQLTHPYNYRACAAETGLDCFEHPEVLESPEGACKSAIWFWNSRHLSELADQGKIDRISELINGSGITPQSRAARAERYRRYLEVFGA